MTFIGRWSPFHHGHIAIINKKQSEHPESPILIMVRDTLTDKYSATVRALYIKQWFLENNVHGTIMIIPNVEGVYWGRGVGYSVGFIDVDVETQEISATNIRKGIAAQTDSWKREVATAQSSYLLSASVSHILDHGGVVWLTGCPSSGKTTIAKALDNELHTRFPHLRTQILDGDDMRMSPLGYNVGFSKKDRADHILRMAYLAKMISDHGILVICAFVSPDRKIREEIRIKMVKNTFIEVFVHASKKTRLKRDSKGLYKKAQKGHLSNLTGYNAAYEKPLHPEIICDTEHDSVETCVELVVNGLLSL